MEFNWIPLKSIGPFKLGDYIENYVQLYCLDYIEHSKDTERDLYKFSEVDIDIYIENETIDSVTCYESCLFNGVELIGLPIKEFIEIINSKPEKDVDTIDMPDGTIQDVYEFDDLGAQVWVDKDEGIVVAVICSPEYEEDEEEGDKD